MRALYDVVYARAAQNWHESINRENFGRWAEHWVNSAKDIMLIRFTHTTPCARSLSLGASAL